MTPDMPDPLDIPKSTAIPPKPELEETQSVYVADKGAVKRYPKTMSPAEIDYDVQTAVRGKTPEDFFVNLNPHQALQRGFQAVKKYMEFQQPAMKLFAVRPDVALGMAKPETLHPDEIQATYKPWIDIWKESQYVKTAREFYKTDELMAKHPVAAFVPWFVAEFVPGEILEFGSKPQNWVGAYGVQKFGPPVINAVLSKMPAGARKTLLTEMWTAEEALVDDFAALGLPPNAKTSAVTNAFREQAMATHPDRGGSADAFRAVREAHDRIMSTRGSGMDKLFDVFRSMPEVAAESFRPPGKVRGLLGFSERGSAIIPFNEGDMVMAGKQIGQFVKMTGEMATVNIGGKTYDMLVDQLLPAPKPGEKLRPNEKQRGTSTVSDAVRKAAVNLKHIDSTEDAKIRLREATDVIRPEMEKIIGRPVTHEEVIEQAKSADLLTAGASREQTLQFEASILKMRQHVAALATQPELTPELLDALTIARSTGTDIARQLESFKINAMPEFAAVKVKMIKDIQKIGVESQEILDASKGVDFTNAEESSKFYRKFIKPRFGESLNEFAYMNILSSLNTHINNTFSNVLLLAGLKPLTKLASGVVDTFVAPLTGQERKHYVSEIGPYYKGAINAAPEAFSMAFDILAGTKGITQLDMKHIPTHAKWPQVATLGMGKYVTRALEASDMLFRTMVEGGEFEALSVRDALNKVPDNARTRQARHEEAMDRAAASVFRSKLDPENESGQGHVLSRIDAMTNAIFGVRGAFPAGKWFMRFVQFPASFLKMNLEYSPLGVVTQWGNKDQSEQIGKALIGSGVFAGSMMLAAQGKITWERPRDKEGKEQFDAAGMRPYSVKLGNNWYEFNKIGPLSGSIALASAINYFERDSPDALTDDQATRWTNAMAGLMAYFSDQSYLQGMGQLIRAGQGDDYALSRFVSGFATQMIPMSSLQGWVNKIIDPMYRKPVSGLSIESVMDNAQQKIIGMSQFVPVQRGLGDEPVAKGSERFINPFSPVQTKPVNQPYEDIYKAGRKERQVKKLEKQIAKKEEAEAAAKALEAGEEFDKKAWRKARKEAKKKEADIAARKQELAGHQSERRAELEAQRVTQAGGTP